MKNYMLVLTCCISGLALTTLVGIALVLCTPIQVSVPVLIFALCAVASVDYQRWVGRK